MPGEGDGSRFDTGRQGVTAAAIYVPEGREINLAALSPRDFETIKGLRGQISHGDRILLCKRASGDQELHVAKSPNGTYFARHFGGGGHGCGEHRISRMTDAHLRGTDMWLTGWDNTGVTTAAEVGTDNHLRLDAVAFGSRIICLETQVQDQKTPTVKRRHTQRRNIQSFTGRYAQTLKDPLQVVWFAPVGKPDWLYEVPSILCANRSWEATPAPETITAVGVQRFDVKPCGPAFFHRCPDKRTGWCNLAHVWREPRRGLSIQHVAEMLADGELAPIRLDSGVYLTDRLGQARARSFGYTEPAPKRTVPRPGRTAACEWDGHIEPGPPLCQLCGKQPAGPGRILCPGCKETLSLRTGGR